MLLGGITVLSAALAALIGLSAGEVRVWIYLLEFLGFFVLGLVLAFGFFFIMCKRVDRSVPQEKDSPFYRKMLEQYLKAVVTLARIKVKTRGMEQLPKEGRFILVCNHLCIADPAVLMYCFPKSQLAFVSKRENDDMFLVGDIMHKLQCQLLNRENDREALKTILKCVEIINDDRASIAVFPEGYCSEDGLLHKFRSGVFKIAKKTGVPIVVCTLRGTTEVIPNLKKLKPSRPELHLVGVVQPRQYQGVTTVELADRIFRMMADDLGPDLVVQDSQDKNG